ncbi:MAG: YqeG family HAD IIIA-type phosphatase [Thermoanaerobacteraceae bacterium]
MYQKLIPDLFADTIYDIDIEYLKKKGIHNLVIDIDNTIVPKKIKFPDKKAIEWFKYLKTNGFKICLISNNTKRRVNEFRIYIEVPAISWAAKPRKGAFKKALRILDAKPNETALIGDQIFTDILGGRRTGLFTILVKPISKEEFGWTKFVRKAERHILKRMKENEG